MTQEKGNSPKVDTLPRWSLKRLMGAMTLAAVYFGFVSYFEPPLVLTGLLAFALVVHLFDSKEKPKMPLSIVILMWVICCLAVFAREVLEFSTE